MATHRSLRIYIVEDSPIVLRLLESLITGVGSAVVGHSDDAAMALGEIGTLRPDVVILDIALRSGTGFDVLRGIAAQGPGRKPVRIMHTNYSSETYRQEAKELGVDYFFDKSAETHEMLKLVASLGIAASRNGSVA